MGSGTKFPTAGSRQPPRPGFLRQGKALLCPVEGMKDISPLELGKGGSLAPWHTGAGVGKCYFIANTAKGIIKSPEIM